MDDEAAIRGLLNEWRAAMQAGDFRTALDLMTDDAVFLRVGQEPLDRTNFTAAASRPRRSSPIVEFMGNIQELRVNGNIAYMWADVSTTTRSSRWAPLVVKRGHSLAVFRKESGNWLLARSADMSITSRTDA
jgi:uncharacterized protein (TIGR02246 family)